MPIIIKLLKSKFFYEQQKRIYFNSSWDEIDKGEKCAYYANIESLHDSVFHFSYYFNNDIKIYEGDFTSFYPHKKKGDFMFYYPNGITRKKVNYENNKPKTGIDYYTNGGVHREYNITEESNIYNQIYDNKGNELLDETGKGEEIFYDSNNDREITFEYINNELNTVYFIDSNDTKIYQLCEKNAKIKAFKNVQSYIETRLDYPINSIKEYNHGYVLVKCIVKPSGEISDFQLIKKMDPFCDKSILDYFELYKATLST